MGEYLGRSYDEVKRRPIYVVEETYNLRPPANPADGSVEPHAVAPR
jgi:hypothetical protein